MFVNSVDFIYSLMLYVCFGVLFSWFVLYDAWFGSLFVFVFIVRLLGRFALGFV